MAAVKALVTDPAARKLEDLADVPRFEIPARTQPVREVVHYRVRHWLVPTGPRAGEYYFDIKDDSNGEHLLDGFVADVIGQPHADALKALDEALVAAIAR